MIKKMLQAKGVPEEQADLVMEIVNKNPELFQQIAKEIDEKMKAGGNQAQVMMEVMNNHRAELEFLSKK